MQCRSKYSSVETSEFEKFTPISVPDISNLLTAKCSDWWNRWKILKWSTSCNNLANSSFLLIWLLTFFVIFNLTLMIYRWWNNLRLKWPPERWTDNIGIPLPSDTVIMLSFSDQGSSSIRQSPSEDAFLEIKD